MNWRVKDRYWRASRGERPQQSFPLWAKQSIVCAFIFSMILGASQGSGGLAGELTQLARQAVNDDITYDQVRTFVVSLPGRVRSLAELDIRNFWSRTVTGERTELAWPCMGQVTSYFGWRPNVDSSGMSLHQGIDIEAPLGATVMSVLDGVVVSVRESPEYGLTVEIEHGGGLSSLYAHLQSVLVKEEQKVKRGETIGTVGQSGNATAPHLHLEVRRDGLEIDPMTILPPLVKGP